MNYKYGIVIVTYNRLSLLKECVEHAINQTIPATKIIIIDNSSTDGTKEYLKIFKNDKRFVISNETENLGGAGGFAKGIRLANQEDLEWIMLIDDDAILDYDCMEKLNPETAQTVSDAYACTVVTDGKIDVSHRRNIIGDIGEISYNNAEFFCDLATFCGLMFRKELIKKIGFPEERYFIWFDDSEYCIRINKYCRIVVRTDARLNHKTKIVRSADRPSYFCDWKEYYGLRNSIHAYKKHGYRKEYWKSVRQALKQIVKFYVFTLKDKRYRIKAAMLCRALIDANSGRLGKNENYLPGIKLFN